MSSPIHTCFTIATTLATTRLTIAIIDCFRVAGITCAFRMKILICTAAFINLLDGFLYYSIIYTLIDGWVLEDFRIVSYSNNVVTSLALITLPLLYISRYDSILIQVPVFKRMLKIAWILPIVFRLTASYQFDIGLAQSSTFHDFFQNVVYAEVGATTNALYTIFEALLVITSDFMVLKTLHSIASDLNIHFWKTIGLARWIRLGIMVTLSTTACLFPFIVAGNQTLEGNISFLQNLAVGYSFSVLLDFYEIDMDIFRRPSRSSSIQFSSIVVSTNKISIT